jgi:hypothetical protein
MLNHLSQGISIDVFSDKMRSDIGRQKIYIRENEKDYSEVVKFMLPELTDGSDTTAYAAHLFKVIKKKLIHVTDDVIYKILLRIAVLSSVPSVSKVINLFLNEEQILLF